MKKLKFIIVFFSISISLAAQSNNISILKQVNTILIEPLTALNSNSRQTNLNITPDGRYIYFMSDRGGQRWSILSGTFKGRARYDGDIWYAQNVNGVWLKPHCLSSEINTWSGEDEPNVSPDGQRVYFQSWKDDWETSGGPYYTAELNNNKWTNVVGLGGGINNFFISKYNVNYYYATDGMSISPDGKTFIVACGDDYDGNLDYYISFKMNNVWIYPKKMNISTDSDERSIFIAADSKTVYFASNGYGGFGGLDIFRATLNDDGTCSNIQNVGEPFNTPQDDYGFIISSDGKDAYFVRDGNIYHAKLSDKNNLAPQPTIIVDGTMYDCDNKKLESKFEVFDQTGNSLISVKSSYSGEFSFVLPQKTGKYNLYDENKNLLYTLNVVASDVVQHLKISINNCYSVVDIEDKVKGAAKDY